MKFQDVKKFALFIESNVGGEDTTALSSITLLGVLSPDESDRFPGFGIGNEYNFSVMF